MRSHFCITPFPVRWEEKVLYRKPMTCSWSNFSRFGALICFLLSICNLKRQRLTKTPPHALKMGFLRTYKKLNKWLNDVKGVMGTRCVGYTSNFEVQYAQIHVPVPWVWVCPYRLVLWFFAEWWKVLIVPPVTKIWDEHHEDWSSTVKYLRGNCVLSSHYHQSDWFCTVSARVPSATIKCSFESRGNLQKHS